MGGCGWWGLERVSRFPGWVWSSEFGVLRLCVCEVHSYSYNSSRFSLTVVGIQPEYYCTTTEFVVRVLVSFLGHGVVQRLYSSTSYSSYVAFSTFFLECSSIVVLVVSSSRSASH